MKDANRQRCYRAEQAVRASLAHAAKDGSAPGDVSFTSDLDARAFLDTVIIPATAALNPLPDFVVKTIEMSPSHKGSSWYRRFAGPKIVLKRWGWNAMVLTHEYSHHLMYARNDGLYSRDTIPSHGGEWARLFLDAVDAVYASIDRPDVAEQLRKQFDAQHAVYQPFDQHAKAVKQVQRVRSDSLKYGDRPTLPFTDIVYAGITGDFTGASYKHTGHCRVLTDSTRSDALLVEQATWDGGTIRLEDLRYVAAPMVRGR